MNALRVRLFTKNGCSLCDSAKAVIVLARQKKPFLLEEIDINDPKNSQWHDKYLFDIPVIHLNGREVFRHRVGEEDFIAVLEKEPSDWMEPSPSDASEPSREFRI